MLLSEDEAIAVARKALSFAKSPACRVRIDGSISRNLRIASRGGATNGTGGGAWLSVTAIDGKRAGSASANAFDEATLARVVAEAEAAAASVPENPEVGPPLGRQAYPTSSNHAEATAKLTTAGLADLLRPVVEGARRADVDYAAFTQSTESWRVLATSRGAIGYDRATRINWTMTARNRRGTWSGWAGADEVDVARIDAAALAETAIEKALATPDPITLEPGKYVALLEPTVVGEAVSWLMGAFNDRPVAEGRSPFSGKTLTDRLFDRRITIVSDPAHPVAPSAPFDGEGVPVRATTWVEDGVIRNLARDRAWATKTGRYPLPLPGAYAMQSGPDTTADMIRSVERGILVTRLWYIRDVDWRTMLFTGLTRDGTFLIENGRIARPIANFRINESPLSILDKVIAIGSSRRVRLSESGAVVSAPPLLVKDFNCTSVSPAV